MLKQFGRYLALVSRIWHAPGNRGQRLNAVMRSLNWLVNKKTGRKTWTLPIFNGVKIRCYPDSIIALHVLQRSEWHDWDTAQIITKFLREGDTFVDVGANIGLYTLPASQIVGEAGSVIAFEPSPVNRARLKENLELNAVKNVRLEACALGEKEGNLAFSDEDALAHVKLAGEGLKVPVRAYDEIAPQIEVAMMKVDVEGFELSVFRGAEKAMKAGLLPVIVFEMNNSFLRYDLNAEEILDFLKAQNYRIGRYEHNTRSIVFHDLEGDLVAFTARGEIMLKERLKI